MENNQNQMQSQKQSQVSNAENGDPRLVAQALGACFVTQRTYGAQGSDFDKAAKVFLRVLADYNPDQIVGAIKQWILKSPEFPTPADIRQIIDPQPIYNGTLFNSAKNRLDKNGLDWYQGRNSDEAYVKFCEKHLKGVR